MENGADKGPPADVVGRESGEPSLPARHERQCRHCSSESINVAYGRYGYYLKSSDCDGNTRIDFTCPACGTKARIRKQKERFFRECKECGFSELFHLNT